MTKLKKINEIKKEIETLKSQIAEMNHQVECALERICKQCYIKIREKNTWFQEGEIIGREEQKKDVLKLIDEDIKIQKEFLKKQPQNKKSIEWRIIGMRLLRLEINGKKEQIQKKAKRILFKKI